MASQNSSSEIVNLVQHLADIVEIQAKELIMLQNRLDSVSTELMNAVKELELVTRKEQKDEKMKQQEIHRLLKESIGKEIKSQFISMLDLKFNHLQKSHEDLGNKQVQLSDHLAELVDCFEKSLIIDEETEETSTKKLNTICQAQQNEIIKIQEEIKTLSKKNEPSRDITVISQIENQLTQFKDDLNLINIDVMKIGNNYEVDYANLNQKIGKVEEFVGSRYATTGSLMLKIQEVSTAKSGRISDLKNEFEGKVADKVGFDDLHDILQNAASVEMVTQLREDIKEICESLENKADAKDLDKYICVVRKIETEICHKIDQTELDDIEISTNERWRSFERGTKQVLVEFKKNTLAKLNLVIDELKSKQDNYSDVCGIVQENVMNEIGQQLYQMSLQVSDIKSMNLNKPIEATFVWRNSRLIQNCIIWDYETLNTNENAISWKPQETHVALAEAGIYLISMAFFTTHKPLIKVLVNGEKLFTVVNSPTFVIGHDSGYINDNGKVRRGSKCGLSVTEYVRIVKNSKLAIMFQGKTDYVEGFLRIARVQ